MVRLGHSDPVPAFDARPFNGQPAKNPVIPILGFCSIVLELEETVLQNSTLGDAQYQFREAIRSAGIPAPERLIADGQLHRFSTGKRRDSNGWYVLFLDHIPAGVFGCWKRGIKQTWSARGKSSLTSQQRRNVSRQLAKARIQSQKAVSSHHRVAAEKAFELWNDLSYAPDNHPYLVRKMIDSNGARVTQDDRLTLPVVDLDRRLCSLQFIAPDGQKRLFTGGRKQGCFIPIAGDLENGVKPLAITEGFATGSTVAKNNPDLCVIAAIDSGNLRAVAIGVRFKWFHRKIVIYGDDDRQSPMNVGRTKATEAARVADCRLEFPPFPPHAPTNLTDFNDMYCWLVLGAING
jgi:putative DNA primase/helicase